MGKTKVCPRTERANHFDSPIFCELETVFRLKIEWKLEKGQGFFENSLPLKFYFSKIFKMIIESSQIAHSIGNFILKNVITGFFLIKWTCEEIWGDIWTCGRKFSNNPWPFASFHLIFNLKTVLTSQNPGKSK